MPLFTLKELLLGKPLDLKTWDLLEKYLRSVVGENMLALSESLPKKYIFTFKKIPTFFIFLFEYTTNNRYEFDKNVFLYENEVKYKVKRLQPLGGSIFLK